MRGREGGRGESKDRDERKKREVAEEGKRDGEKKSLSPSFPLSPSLSFFSLPLSLPTPRPPIFFTHTSPKRGGIYHMRTFR